MNNKLEMDQIADIKVSPENVESINYGNTARIIYGDGLVVDITCNSGGVLMVEINDESSSDAAVTTALWLFTKAIDDEISDEELDKAINELCQGDYRVCQVKCVNFFVNFWWSVKPDHLFLT